MPPPEARVVVALAGRRIDPADATVARFPLERVEAVRGALRARFLDRGAAALVCSAACGADLVALEVARELDIPAHVVLPFEPSRFRETSVVDRPGNWGRYFDEEVARARLHGRLTILPASGDGDDAYARTNVAILDAAEALAERLDLSLLALLVWDGRSRGEGDLTEGFGRLAQARDVLVEEVRTIGED